MVESLFWPKMFPIESARGLGNRDSLYKRYQLGRRGVSREGLFSKIGSKVGLIARILRGCVLGLPDVLTDLE